MAANTIEPGSSLAELASTLDLSQVPDKLHCSTCRKFLVNAYRTTCCESYVCDACFEQLDDHCPVCQHKPFSKDLVRPNKAMRGTAKAYLKSVEKAQAEERAKSQTNGTPTTAETAPDAADELESGMDVAAANETRQEVAGQVNGNNSGGPATPGLQPSIEVGSPVTEGPAGIHASMNSDVEPGQGEVPYSSADNEDEDEDDDDDEIEIQVEPAEGDEFQMHSTRMELYEEDNSFRASNTEDNSEAANDHKDGHGGMDTNFNGNNMSNMGMNFSMNTPPMQMMQQMQQMMMNNPMMGAMGMNPNLFGGFNNGGMNGMDMNMMNFASQNMFGWNGQSNNNFNNAYSNGMNGSFGPSFGFDMSQQGNFQQQFQNGDFQSGYSDYRGRGRGRFRGGRGSFRGRGHFNQFSQNNLQGAHNVFEQQQQQQQHDDVHPLQQQTHEHSKGSDAGHSSTNVQEAEQDHRTTDFAPGGQTEVQEALGNQHGTSHHTDEDRRSNGTPKMDWNEPDLKSGTSKPATEEGNQAQGSNATSTHNDTIPEAYHEDIDTMAPPSAPLGPSGRHADRDFGFRARGRGKYGHHPRASFSHRDSNPVSPISATTQSPKGLGLGVQGAPTGPRAMRDPVAPKANPISSGSGFQIKGQAAMQSQSQPQSQPQPQPRTDDRIQSPSRSDDYRSSDDRDARRESRHDRDRRHKRTRREDYDDHDMEDVSQVHSRSGSHERRSHRSGKHDKERDRDRYSSRHKPSRAQAGEDDHGTYDADEPDMGVEHRSSGHRSGKSTGKYDDWDRDRDRDRERHRDRDREKDRERDRHRDHDRDRDRDERHRKRSRHERDRDDEMEDADDSESRHRSRRHKKDHHSSSIRNRDRDEHNDLGLRISRHPSSNRNPSVSALPTPTSAKGEAFEPEKDPHTLEREARNKERMLKEQQRREKAAADKKGTSGNKYGRGTVSGGRRVSYKYEDEIERNMDESDRRWR